MSGKRGVLIVLVTLVVVLMVVIGLQVTGVAYARPPAQQPDPAGITIPYPGRLAGDDGSAVVDGAYDFSFALYDASIGGNRLWSEVQVSVVVRDGGFVVSLGSVEALPAALVEGDVWLEVAVRGPTEDAFTAMSPRQQLRTAYPAPAAAPGQAAPCPHDHWGESWSGTGVGLMLDDTSAGHTVMIPGVLAAVFGDSGAWGGVWGRSQQNIGVLGESTDGYGVMGTSTNSWGGWFDSGGDHFDVGLGGDVGRVSAHDSATSQLYLSANGDVIIKLDNDSGGDHVLRVKNSGGGDVCTINEAGDLACTGGKTAVMETADYGWRKLYAMESPELWYEDFGSATLAKGEVTVTFEPIFAQTVNTEEDYFVFLTLLGDEPVLLLVSEKTAEGFTVKGVTLDGQPASASFDYRIVAKRLGYEDVRLGAIDWQVQEGE
jgi:hypothetical protein